MLKQYYFLILVLFVVSIPAAHAQNINSTIGTPDSGFTFSSIQNKTNDAAFTEFNLEKWNQISNIEEPNIQPIFFPIIVLITFLLTFSAAMKAKGDIVVGLYFIISFLMAFILTLMFSGSQEYGYVIEHLGTQINTATGTFEILKTYETVKIIPLEDSFRPVYALIFNVFFYFSILMFIVKSFLQPFLEKKEIKKQAQD